MVRLNTEEINETWDFHAGFGTDDWGSLAWQTGRVNVRDVTTIWYRRPHPIPRHGADAVAAQFAAQEWTAALEGILEMVPVEEWMNYPGRIAAASHKPEQLRRARRFGLPCPETIITTSSERAGEFIARLNAPVVSKPLMSGYIERTNPIEDSVIYTSKVDAAALVSHGPSLGCPTLFQRAISRTADVRVTVVDHDLIAVAMTARDGRVDIRRENFGGVSYAPIVPPPVVQEQLLGLVAAYGLRFAAIDMIIGQDGTWYFLEINPNGQWAWLDLVADVRIHEMFERSFAARLGGHCA